MYRNSCLRARLVCGLALAGVLMLTGCQGDQEKESEKLQVQAEAHTEEKSDERTSAVTFTDDLGREVAIDQPQRVAALLGSYADVWHLAGGTVCASADDAWEDFELDMPEDAVNLGMTKEISLEKLLEAEPDFIIASTNTRAHMDMLDSLEASGIPTAYFDVSDFEGYLHMLDLCTQITGRRDLYETNGLAVQEQIAGVIEKSQERLLGEEAPKVLYLRASASNIRAKNSEGTILGEMLKNLGCENIADSQESLLENLNIEYILKEDPDYIFAVQSGDDISGTQAALEELFGTSSPWSALTAVKEGRVHYLDKRLYNLKPNARWGEAYEELEGILSNE